eukprot:CAMPEP_0114501182 /NCGR_PEP_ID=MMETSP0109-20121206/8362_1 /TAXON_ID=29199 /ORGANISM="Chlorarachnion reptans, Strain CCCM449" /LENGTH=110 /DNA_ID=CAMNT_0001678895 /DNA_START=384 /DNA_END=716 /DNA_ORIENTATION=+
MAIEFGKKYRWVRFVERKKAQRLYQKARKIQDKGNRTKELTTARDMLRYIDYYPKNEKYISLFKNFDKNHPQYEGQQRRLERDRSKMMQRIKKQCREIDEERLTNSENIE